MTSLSEAHEIVAAEEARRRDAGEFTRGPDPDRVARHLATGERTPRERQLGKALREMPAESRDEKECNEAVADWFDPPPPKREEPKWGVERRKRIAQDMAKRPVGDMGRFEVINYTRKQCGANDLRHFFDVVADETMMRHVERILKL